MTPSDLDEIRKRCETANGPPLRTLTERLADSAADVAALLDEVERLNRIDAAPPRCSGCSVELGDPWCAKCATEAECDRLRARLALLEPVWEAAKRWRRRGNPDECWELCDAIDAAVAKEGK